MNWTYETWRKLYVRETGEFASLSWMARAVAAMLLKYVDDRGRIFPRAGEAVEDAICERMGAGRGERRMIKPAIAELLRDGHLVKVGTHMRIKNFAQAQGRSIGADVVANDQRTLHDDATTTPPPSNDSGATTSRPWNDRGTTVQRPCNEESHKCASSFSSHHDVPSVPSGPSVPTPESPLTPARDPADGAAESGDVPGVRIVPVLRPFVTAPVMPQAPTSGAITGQQLRDTWGRVFASVIGGKTEWQVASGTRMFERTEAIARLITSEDVPHIEPTMVDCLKQALESQDEEDRERHFAFGSWWARFPDMRDKRMGLRKAVAPPPAPPAARASPRGELQPKPYVPDAAATARRLEEQATCSFHREIPDKPSAEYLGWCRICKRLGPRRPRTAGPTEPEPLSAGVKP